MDKAASSKRTGIQATEVKVTVHWLVYSCIEFWFDIDYAVNVSQSKCSCSERCYGENDRINVWVNRIHGPLSNSTSWKFGPHYVCCSQHLRTERDDLDCVFTGNKSGICGTVQHTLGTHKTHILFGSNFRSLFMIIIRFLAIIGKYQGHGLL